MLLNPDDEGYKKLKFICLIMSLLFAGDEKEDFSFGHDKMVNCVTACIQIARATDIIQQQKNLIDFFLVSLSPNFSWPGIAS